MVGSVAGGAAVVGGLVVVGATVGSGSVGGGGGGGAWVVGVVVWTGRGVVAGLGGGEAVGVLRGVVATTRGWVGAVVSPGSSAAAAVVVDDSTVDDVDVDEELELVAAPRVVVGRAVVDGDCLATCCLDDVSSPVTTSNNRAAKATVARA